MRDRSDTQGMTANNSVTLHSGLLLFSAKILADLLMRPSELETRLPKLLHDVSRLPREADTGIVHLVLISKLLPQAAILPDQPFYRLRLGQFG